MFVFDIFKNPFFVVQLKLYIAFKIVQLKLYKVFDKNEKKRA